jgi:hypothetical protein
MMANCRKKKGAYTVYVNINLDRCFTNENGHLKGKWKYVPLILLRTIYLSALQWRLPKVV